MQPNPFLCCQYGWKNTQTFAKLPLCLGITVYVKESCIKPFVAFEGAA